MDGEGDEICINNRKALQKDRQTGATLLKY